jgi:type II secretory pathway pseudopilin PulG
MPTSRKSRRNTGRSEDGYILITLMLFAAVILIMLAAVVPKLTQQMRRDREEEMIHRGVQYARAVRRFYKKTGRYPVRLEELENTNNIRFLRKRYKDPIAGKDFKVLHYGEVRMAFGGGMAGASAPGSPVGNLTGAANISGQGQLGSQPNQPDLTSTPDESTSSSSSTSSSQSSSPFGGSSSSSGILSPSSSGGAGNQVFGGGPIVGVVSTSKKESIREFNKKNHYNDWQFIYDPATDRGGLLNTPAQPALQGGVGVGQPGQPGQPGSMPGIQSPGAGGAQTPPINPQPQPPMNQEQPQQ